MLEWHAVHRDAVAKHAARDSGPVELGRRDEPEMHLVNVEVVVETGERKHVAVAKRVKSWTFNADNGKLCVNVRYGARVLDLGKGKTAVELSSTKELVATLETISAAVNAGELDAEMVVYFYFVSSKSLFF